MGGEIARCIYCNAEYPLTISLDGCTLSECPACRRAAAIAVRNLYASLTLAERLALASNRDAREWLAERRLVAGDIMGVACSRAVPRLDAGYPVEGAPRECAALGVWADDAREPALPAPQIARHAAGRETPRAKALPDRS